MKSTSRRRVSSHRRWKEIDIAGLSLPGPRHAPQRAQVQFCIAGPLRWCSMAEPSRKTVPVAGAELDVLVGGRDEPGAGTVCTAHPVESMDDSLALLADITRARVVCVNPRGVGRSSPTQHPGDSTLEVMADDLDAVRRSLGLPRWVIWGMSGGSMIAQVYACLHSETLEGLILDSAGPCFSLTLRDAECVMSPSFPRWRDALRAAGLLPA